MINFVIIEDNKLHMKKVGDIIDKYMMKSDIDYEVTKIENPEIDFKKLYAESDKNFIYLIDFELGNGITAIDVAREIRKFDWKSQIIVISVNPGMALETFKQRLLILDFISKLYKIEDNLFELFDLCIENIKKDKALIFKNGKNEYLLNHDKILYIYYDSYLRKSVAITDNNKYLIPLTLNKVKELLDNKFCFSHRSCIVNTRRVLAYNFRDKIITFDNGKTIDLLSSAQKKEIEETIS